MHAGAVVAEQRLGHERGGITQVVADVLDHVLVRQQPVRGLHQGAELEVDLGLAGGGHLVVLDLDRDAGLDQRQHDLRAHVLQAIHRWDREVSLLVPRPVPQVGAAAVPARVPDPLFGVDVVVALVRVLVEPHAVENEELGLGAPVRGGRDSGRLEVLLGLEGDEARIARVRLERERIVDVAGERERRHLQHRIDECRRDVGEEQHVALVDGLEAADRGAVEAQPLPDHLLVERGGGDREMLPRAGEVAELHVHDLDVLLPDEVEHLADFTRLGDALLRAGTGGGSHVGLALRVEVGVYQCDAPAACERRGIGSAAQQSGRGPGGSPSQGAGFRWNGAMRAPDSDNRLAGVSIGMGTSSVKGIVHIPQKSAITSARSVPALLF